MYFDPVAFVASVQMVLPVLASVAELLGAVQLAHEFLSSQDGEGVCDFASDRSEHNAT